MIQTKTYKIPANLDARIALLADIHFSETFPKKRFSHIIQHLKINKPDYICIPGDIIDRGNCLFDPKVKNELFSFVRELSSIAPVIIGLGNHDMAVPYKGEFLDEAIFELSEIPNVYLLHNKAISKNGICFLGLTLPYSYYYNTPHENAIDYSKLLDNTFISAIQKNQYHVLLCHAPYYALSKSLKQSKVLSHIDLILSGHMHNGLVPFCFNNIGGNHGLVSPFKGLFPKEARGYIKRHNHHVITGGVLTFSGTTPKFIQKFNFLYPPHIDYIELKKEKSE